MRVFIQFTVTIYGYAYEIMENLNTHAQYKFIGLVFSLFSLFCHRRN